MKKIEISADALIESLLQAAAHHQVSILDSCGVRYLGSRYLIAGVDPVETLYLNDENPQKTLELLDEKFAAEDRFHIFTISYDFGLKLQNIGQKAEAYPSSDEPDVFLAVYDALIVHDYETRETRLVGSEKKFGGISALLKTTPAEPDHSPGGETSVLSNFTKEDYLETIEKVRELIRQGRTYQTNLTQQFRARLPEALTAEKIFRRLRKNNPAPFAAFIRRESDRVVSISPERFFRVENSRIETSPIKGTRRRGRTRREDERLKNELLTNAKDRAENTMIVDLLRNDLGRVCRFGSVRVEKLCELEAHPTFFHLVSTVSGDLKKEARFSDILRAVFPCGSITGAPKISTMRIIAELETAPRGLSMGAIGYSIKNPKFKIQNSVDLNVAIRTMVVKNREAVFSVGGGILIDSAPESEYAETLVKAKAIFRALDADQMICQTEFE